MTTMDILKRTKSAWPSICNAAAEDKNRILSAMADSLQAECDAILRCNAEDMDAARGHISDVMLDRLYLDRGRIGQEDVAYLTKDGAEFISERQDAIWICGA